MGLARPQRLPATHRRSRPATLRATHERSAGRRDRHRPRRGFAAQGAGLTAGARHFRLTSSPAVIVADEARLLDEAGKPLPQKRGGSADSVTIPEGASVYVLERRPTLYRVAWGSSEGWLSPGQVRILATRLQ